MFFNTQAEFNDGIESNSGFKWVTLKPSIAAAENRFLKPIIGKALFDDLVTKYNVTGNALTGKELELFTLCQKALRRLAIYVFIPIGEVQISDAGLTRVETDSKKGAFKYQVQELQKAQLDMGLELLEDVIEYLDSNAADFGLWTASDEYQFYKDLLIKTGKDFQLQYSFIKYPRRLFCLLRSTMLTVQETIISDTISADIYDELIDELKEAEPNLSEEQKKLLGYIKKAIAFFTIAKGVPHLLASMDENGIHILNSSSDSADASSKRTSATDSIISTLIRNAESSGTAWLDKAVEFLNKTASDSVFESWYEKIVASANSTQSNFNTNAQGSFAL